MNKEWLVTEKVQAHETNMHMIQSVPTKVAAGTDIGLKIGLSCLHACDLRGSIVRIVAQNAVVVKEIELATFNETVNETGEFVVQAPIEPGEYTWTAVFPAQEKEAILHEESSAPFSFIVKPHATSIAVWDVSSPIAFGDKFKIKVGVKCSAGCKLTDRGIEIYDHEGQKAATATLGDVPWPETSALHWAEVELDAPGVEGYYAWTAKFPKPDLELSHKEALHTFGFRTGKPAEHVVTVEVIDKDTKTPIKSARVFLHPYRGYTDERGVAKLEVSKGEYKLYVSKDDEYVTFQTTVEITDDATIKAELLFFPNPYR
jgi:hypothetical protein